MLGAIQILPGTERGTVEQGGGGPAACGAQAQNRLRLTSAKAAASHLPANGEDDKRAKIYCRDIG